MLAEETANATPYEEKPAANADLVAELEALRDRRYCDACDLSKRTECLGWEQKAKDGRYGKPEHEAHKKVDAMFGESKGVHDAIEIIRKYRPVKAHPVEPLAVLADRKGYSIKQIERFAPNLPVPEEWYISIETEGLDVMGCPNGKIFTAPTHAACEAKARAYLDTLPDTK